MYDKHDGWLLTYADEKHLPHIRVSWYDGGIWMSGTCAVLAGETLEQAAERAFDAKLDPKGPSRGRRGDSVTIHPIEVFEKASWERKLSCST